MTGAGASNSLAAAAQPPRPVVANFCRGQPPWRRLRKRRRSCVEWITSTDGLGHVLVRAARNFQTVDMFVPIIAISLLGLALNAGFNALRAQLLIGFPEES